MAARFEVRHQRGKGYHFVLIATNGQVIATSEHYETHRACLGGTTPSNATPTLPTRTPPAAMRTRDRAAPQARPTAAIVQPPTREKGHGFHERRGTAPGPGQYRGPCRRPRLAGVAADLGSGP
ncbi:YegP family protein [Streptomyces toxytricini]|uniref:YegP family protein n=1 Tax=Streptomyces toxytricini TaxID=67369 RepID=A0ABW8EF94_STRT5